MGLLQKLRNFLPLGRPLIPRDPISYRAIGVVRNRVSEYRTAGWEDIRSDIFLREDLAPALEGIEGFSHVIVVFHMHTVSDDDRRLLTLPLAGENAGEIGLFATRIAVRPNAVGVSAVPVVWRRKNVLRVRGLDALNGTPVLDIKPYLPPYDSIPGATLPAWAQQAMQR
ncbi:MAG TPA: tRNA (N6-threonylcarbamoyladenosine(37)-N6)-methyltransferase TrmO [Dehalococcoidia bacterium]|nr:tRNA (N6-threonylcarbamoyladenosine(37)-N6)-methyltransferase TrmO [Dehalococcoidia bacterium]